jgi:[ribosomal protein S5]-alanine N-acetyltransferase
LGYFIKKEYWNKGYVIEAGKEVFRFAFEENDVHKIETGCLKENIGSERVMQKLGMRKEAELIEQSFHEGLWKDRLIYGITKQDWLKLQTVCASPSGHPAQKVV